MNNCLASNPVRSIVRVPTNRNVPVLDQTSLTCECFDEFQLQRHPPVSRIAPLALYVKPQIFPDPRNGFTYTVTGAITGVKRYIIYLDIIFSRYIFLFCGTYSYVWILKFILCVVIINGLFVLCFINSEIIFFSIYLK